MSDIFEKREEGYEWKFAHDEELRFKAIARRNKMLGEWAAKKLGLTGAAGDSYAKEIVMSELADGDHDVFKRIRHDFDSKGLAVVRSRDSPNYGRIAAAGYRADQCVTALRSDPTAVGGF